jgi:arsenite methyltransferase
MESSLKLQMRQLARRRGDYGLDEPVWPKLPFSDSSFDLVVSSLAIHNIRNPEGREQAIDEAVRVLKAGGRLVIADFRETQRYGQRLRELGMTEVAHHTLGWRFWYGGFWAATKLVNARKP